MSRLSDPCRRGREHIAALVLALLLLLSTSGCALVRFEYTPDTMCPKGEKQPIPGKLMWSVLTVNTWRLEEEHRVDKLIKMLSTLGTHLHPRGKVGFPDVVFFQELEGVYHWTKEAQLPKHPSCTNPQSLCRHKAISGKGMMGTFRMIQKKLKKHWFGFCVCAHDEGQKTIRKYSRSAVGMAIRLDHFGIKASQLRTHCCPLPVQWKTSWNHGRCAMLVELPIGPGKRLLLSSVHISTPTTPRDKEVQCLLDVMRTKWQSGKEKQSVVFGGDFNFCPRSEHYKKITSQNTKPTSQVFKDTYSAKRGRTNPGMSRIDMLFTSQDIARVKSLDQKVAFDAVLHSSAGCKAPLSELKLYTGLPCRCSRAKVKYKRCYPCPVSDHLPEGALYQIQDLNTAPKKAK